MVPFVRALHLANALDLTPDQGGKLATLLLVEQYLSGGRQDHAGIHLFRESLCLRIKVSESVDLIAEQLHTDGFPTWRIHIDDSTADGKLSRSLHQFLPRVSGSDQLFRKHRGIDSSGGIDTLCVRAEKCRRDRQLQQCFRSRTDHLRHVLHHICTGREPI